MRRQAALGGERGGAMSTWSQAHDFMPDARGLAEQRRSPLAGALILLLSGLLAAALVWASWARIEQVVRAQGRVEPTGRVKIVNHPQGGRIAEILVAEGERVVPGQVLVRFDPAAREEQLAELTGSWQAQAVTVARLEAEAQGSALRVPEDLARARPDLVEAQARLLEARRAARAAQAEALARQLEARDGEVEAAKADQARLQRSVRLARKQLDGIRQLAEQGLYPQLRLLAVEQQVGELEGELAKTRARQESAEAARAEALSRQAAQDTEWRSAVLADLAQATAARDRLAAQLDAAAAALDQLVVTAPVEGIVQGITVTAIGQAVGATDELMRIVPVDGGIVVRARVEDKDAADVRLGQRATVKLRAYDFLRYGTVEGEVVRIAAAATADPQTGAVARDVEIRTFTDHLQGRDGALPLSAGMQADVELGIGDRTVLSFFTDRLRRLGREALREG
jgi:HlyD family type I secretion membrane fusion protein